MSNGKGDKPRNCFSQQFKDNYDQINWAKSEPAKSEPAKAQDKGSVPKPSLRKRRASVPRVQETQEGTKG
jgi:hypothetical protein